MRQGVRAVPMVWLVVTLLATAGARPLSAKGTATAAMSRASAAPRSAPPVAPVAPAAPVAPVADVEPPPAPLEEPEPEPAPLHIEPSASERAAEVAAQRAAADEAARRARLLRAYTAVGWVGVATTLTSILAGTTLGILAQQRSDAQSRLTTQLVDGLPPIYDAAQDAEWIRLHDEGRRFNGAAIGLLVFAGVEAIGTGVLFWERERLFGKDLALSLPTLRVGSREVALTIGGRF